MPPPTGPGGDVVTPCAACFSRLKTAAHALEGNAAADIDVQLSRPVRVLHILELLGGEGLAGPLAEQIVRPLTGLKARRPPSRSWTRVRV